MRARVNAYVVGRIGALGTQILFDFFQLKNSVGDAPSVDQSPAVAEQIWNRPDRD
jgi:hypothetical protein